MKRRNERILVILNPSSGVVSKDIATSVIFKQLRKGFKTVSIINSNSPEHGYEITRQSLDNFDIITAFGGDGTVNSIAAAMIDSGKILGILPGGSGNGLVRNLNIPLSWRRALDVLAHGKDVKIDAGRINDHYFFNVAGVGLDGFISKKFNLESKTRGIVPYIYYGFKGYFEIPDFRVRIRFGDSQLEEEILLVAFANFRQYGGKAVIAPFAAPDDRKLDLCVIQRFNFLRASLNIQKLFTGNIHKLPFYKSETFERLTIKSLSGPMPATVDGEYFGEDMEEYTIEVIPAPIRVRVPR